MLQNVFDVYKSISEVHSKTLLITFWKDEKKCIFLKRYSYTGMNETNSILFTFWSLLISKFRLCLSYNHENISNSTHTIYYLLLQTDWNKDINFSITCNKIFAYWLNKSRTADGWRWKNHVQYMTELEIDFYVEARNIMSSLITLVFKLNQ